MQIIHLLIFILSSIKLVDPCNCIILPHKFNALENFSWRIISMRIFVNTSVIALFGLSAYAVVKMVVRSSEELEQTNWWRQNEITVVLSLITYVFPSFFEILGLLESYHPRKQLRLQLARCVL